jgi:hypothetical protein
VNHREGTEGEELNDLYSHQKLSEWSNQGGWQCGACSTYGGESECIQAFGGQTWSKETAWKI